MSRSILKSWWDTVKQVNITKESNCDLHSMRLKLRAIMGFIILVVLYCTNNCLILVFILPVAGHQVNDFIQHCPLRWQLVPIMFFLEDRFLPLILLMDIYMWQTGLFSKKLRIMKRTRQALTSITFLKLI